MPSGHFNQRKEAYLTGRLNPARASGPHTYRRRGCPVANRQECSVDDSFHGGSPGLDTLTSKSASVTSGTGPSTAEKMTCSHNVGNTSFVELGSQSRALDDFLISCMESHLVLLLHDLNEPSAAARTFHRRNAIPKSAVKSRERCRDSRA
ncbi:hypothetical protein AcV5_010444 [Taiwanofungus camphoratus]|nr:hypothetical protein AcV5_010444 [Antrodia cinnamomea]